MKINSDKAAVFDRNTLEYDQWFEKHPAIYQSEFPAIEQALSENKTGIEIGVGTGRFAKPFRIKFGIEPSGNMAKVAEQRGIKGYRAYAENHPIEHVAFDFALMVTTVCFRSDIPKAFSEIHCILKPEGEMVVAIIDKNSELGRKYEIEKFTSKFYRDTHFHATEELTELL